MATLDDVSVAGRLLLNPKGLGATHLRTEATV